MDRRDSRDTGWKDHLATGLLVAKMIIGLIFGITLWPLNWAYSMYIWPHTKRGKKEADRLFQIFSQQLESTDDPDMAFACWLDYAGDFKPYPQFLQRGWDLLKVKSPVAAKNYQQAYPRGLRVLEIKP